MSRDAPLTSQDVAATIADLWRDQLVGEHVNLGHRWIGVIIPDGGTWRCEAAAPKKTGFEIREKLSRRATGLSAARTYLHQLGRHVYTHHGVADEAGFGLWIPGVAPP